MDLRYTFATEGLINNYNPSIGCSTGLKLNQAPLSMGMNMGMDGSIKEGATGFLGGSVGYNSELGINRYDKGLFADGSVKYKTDFGTARYDEYGYENDYVVKNGENYNFDVGIRTQSSYAKSHANISAFGELNKFDGKTDKIYGGKYEISDGTKAMFAKVGMKDDGEKSDLYLGMGARMAFGF